MSGSERRNTLVKFLTVAALSAACFGLYATVTFPPIIVTAPRIGGGTVVCRGEACAGVLQSLQETGGSKGGDQSDHENPTEDIPVNPAALCANLNANKPSNCSLSNPPSSPGITVPGQPAWSANGCGTGGIGSWFQDAILEVVTSQSYSGDIHAPYPGVSFRTACDAHDACWASGALRAECDNTFRDSTQAACSIVSSPAGRSTCSGFGSLYHGAVTTTNGSHNAYSTSSNNRECALWASDMRENNCAN